MAHEKKNLSLTRSLKDIKKLKAFSDLSNIKLLNFLPIVSTSFLAVFFEGISLVLLMPTIRGIIEMNFGFVSQNNYLNFFFDLVFGSSELKNRQIFFTLILLILASAALKNVFWYVSNTRLASLGAKFAHALRTRCFERLLNFGKSYFDINSQGKIYHLAIGIPQRLPEELKELNNAFTNTLMVLMYFSLMLVISWPLTIIALLLVPVLHFSVQWVIERIQNESEKIAESQVALNKKISNAFTCIPLIHAFNKQFQENEWLAKLSHSIRRYELKEAKFRFLVSPIQEMILLFMLVIIISCMAYLFVTQKVGEISGYVLFFILLRRLGGSFSVIYAFQSSLARMSGLFIQFEAIFTDDDKYIVPNGTKRLEEFKDKIEFRNLNFCYPNRETVLKDVSFSIPRGKMVAIVGKTGAGKSTLINLMLRYYDVAPGSLLIDGVDIREYDMNSLRNHMSVVSQATYLFNESIRRNLTYGLDRKVTDEEIIDALKRAHLFDFVSLLSHGIETEIGDNGIQLSGGEKQRLSIAQAILRRTDILLLDEATSALDSKTEKEIQESLGSLLKGKTSVVIAHRLSTIQSADKIVVLDKGKVVEEGNLETLLNRKGVFCEQWNAQMFD